VGLLALFVGAEGIGLMTNWRGGADEIGRLIRGEPEPDSYTLRYLGSGHFIRGTLGSFCGFAGCVFLWAAIRYALHGS